jgi:hypothetical protein
MIVVQPRRVFLSDSGYPRVLSAKLSFGFQLELVILGNPTWVRAENGVAPVFLDRGNHSYGIVVCGVRESGESHGSPHPGQ